MPDLVTWQPSRASLRVLVVEDEPRAAESLVQGLCRHGHRAESVSTGAEALRAHRSADDNWINAAMVERCGLGLNREPGDVDAALLKTLLHDEGLRASVRDGARALAAEPGPEQIVPRLASLTEK
ncbi:hypothetical protein QIS99_27355 [Streptomyces sp. B-S-A8]|uniref:Response regulatory domain-containing protein n=1 Tax=Streptomyces solicavernae TaxID=3043614 RepID=A0ABT6RZX4_9ACTN|nr:hypothetical protein [Streptomyces sp. B-S-A8]MDI3389880.1 hypothetical protein [Streptomyces sp. B-S-A8]